MEATTRSNGGQASSSSSRISAAAPSSLKTKAVKELEEKYGKLLPTPSLLHLRHPYPGELDKSSQDLFFACEARINKIALRPGPVLGHYQEELFTEIRTPTDRDRLLPKLARKARKKKHLGLDVENTSTRDNSLNVLLLGFPGHELVGIRLRHFPSFEDAVGPDMAEVLRDSSVKKLGIGVEEDVKQLQKQGGLSVEGACDLRPFLRRSWEDGGFSAIQNPERKESVKFFLHVVCGADNTLFFRGSSRGKYASHLKYFGEEYNDSTLPPSRTLQNVLQFGRPARPGALVAPGGEGQDPRLGKWQRRYCAGDAMFPLLIVDREAQRRIMDSPAKKMVEDSLLESILSDMEEAAAQEEEEAAEKTAAPRSKKRRGKVIEHLFSIAGYEKILEKRGEQTEEAEEIDWQKANQGGTMHKRIARERDDGDIEVISINVHDESRFEDEEEDISEGQAEQRQKKEKRKSTESSSPDDEGPGEEATKEPAEADKKEDSSDDEEDSSVDEGAQQEEDGEKEKLRKFNRELGSQLVSALDREKELEKAHKQELQQKQDEILREKRQRQAERTLHRIAVEEWKQRWDAKIEEEMRKKRRRFNPKYERNYYYYQRGKLTQALRNRLKQWKPLSYSPFKGLCKRCLAHSSKRRCRVDIDPCVYPICQNKLSHSTPACPTLQRRCERCGCRGHYNSGLDCLDPRIPDMFRHFCHLGKATKYWWGAPKWDFNPNEFD